MCAADGSCLVHCPSYEAVSAAYDAGDTVTYCAATAFLEGDSCLCNCTGEELDSLRSTMQMCTEGAVIDSTHCAAGVVNSTGKGG